MFTRRSSAMRRPDLRQKTERTLNHLAMGTTLGVLLAIGLLIGNTSKIYALIVGAYGSVSGPLGLIVGCAMVIGVGAAITGFIFDEVELS